MSEPVPNDLFPPISQALLDALRSRIGLPVPRPDGSERRDLYAAGQYSVVEMLQAIFNQQNDESIEEG